MKAVGGMWQRQLALVLTLGMAVSSQAYTEVGQSGKVSGFEVGNGSVINRDYSSSFSLESLEQLDPDYDGKVMELYAPSSDGGYPRTWLRVVAFAVGMSAEEALKAFMGTKGWVEFSAGRILGIHRETQVRKDGWSRLEMQLFRGEQKFVISLEGNKNKSKAYSALSTSLLEEVED